MSQGLSYHFTTDFISVRQPQEKYEVEGCSASSEKKEDMGQASRDKLCPSQMPAVVHRWGEIMTSATSRTWVPLPLEILY